MVGRAGSRPHPLLVHRNTERMTRGYGGRQRTIGYDYRSRTATLGNKRTDTAAEWLVLDRSVKLKNVLIKRVRTTQTVAVAGSLIGPLQQFRAWMEV